MLRTGSCGHVTAMRHACVVEDAADMRRRSVDVGGVRRVHSCILICFCTFGDIQFYVVHT